MREISMKRGCFSENGCEVLLPWCAKVPRLEQGSVPKSRIQWSVCACEPGLTVVGAARIEGCPMNGKVAGGGSDDTVGHFSFI